MYIYRASRIGIRGYKCIIGKKGLHADAGHREEAFMDTSVVEIRDCIQGIEKRHS